MCALEYAIRRVLPSRYDPSSISGVDCRPSITTNPSVSGEKEDPRYSALGSLLHLHLATSQLGVWLGGLVPEQHHGWSISFFQIFSLNDCLGTSDSTLRFHRPSALGIPSPDLTGRRPLGAQNG